MVISAALAASPAVELGYADYTAAAADFAALQEGIQAAEKLRPRLFPKGIEQIDIALYDSRNVYLYSKNTGYDLPKRGAWKGYVIYQSSHSGKVSEREMARCGGTPDYVTSVVPRSFPRMFSCSPWTIQGQIQKKRKSIYDTQESYLGTVIHEFGHAYHGQQGEVDIPILAAIQKKAERMESKHPSRRIVQEAYAIWCELKGAEALLPGHFKRLRKDFIKAGADDPHNLGTMIASELLDEETQP